MSTYILSGSSVCSVSIDSSSSFFLTLSMACTHDRLSSSDSTQNVRTTTVVICNPLTAKVKGLGRLDSMISQFLTVKLLRGSLSSASDAGFCLKPMKRPSSFRMKYRERQLRMCSPLFIRVPSFTTRGVEEDEADEAMDF